MPCLEIDQVFSSQERFAPVVNERGGHGCGGASGVEGVNAIEFKIMLTETSFAAPNMHSRKYCWDLIGKPPCFSTTDTAETEISRNVK